MQDNDLASKIEFYNTYFTKVIPQTRDIHDYIALWKTLVRFNERTSESGDIYQLIRAEIGEESAPRLKSLRNSIKRAINLSVPAKTKYDLDLSGYENIFETLWGDDILHPAKAFLDIYDSEYRSVELEFLDFVTSIRHRINAKKKAKS